MTLNIQSRSQNSLISPKKVSEITGISVRTLARTHMETVRAKDGRVAGYSSINTDTFVKDAMIKELHKIMGAEAQRGK